MNAQSDTQQLLHHSYTFDVEYDAMIMRDNNNDMIWENFVKFDTIYLKSMHGNVLTHH
jgi:hypothetical protein